MTPIFGVDPTHPRRLLPLLTLIAVVSIGAAGSDGHRLPRARHCPVFPATNAWNQRVDGRRVAPGSATLVRSIGLDAPAHPDFGSDATIGIPYAVVTRRQRRVRVTFDFADESDAGRYPLPRDVPIEGGRTADGDRHVIVLLADNGSPWFFSGAPDRRWDDDDLHTLTRLHGSDFEVVG